MDQLESSLEKVFVKSAPKLPQGAKDFIVSITPWVSLIGGVLTLLSAYWLWHWAHAVNALINYANQLSAAFGGSNVVSNRLTVGIWIALIVLIVEGLVYLAAFPGTRDHKKAGWNWLFYGLLINVVYGIVLLFTNYGGVGNFISYLIGSIVGLYFLFQIRSSYN